MMLSILVLFGVLPTAPSSFSRAQLDKWRRTPLFGRSTGVAGRNWRQRQRAATGFNVVGAGTQARSTSA